MRLFSFLILLVSLTGGFLAAQTLTDSLKFRYDLGTNYHDLGPTANHLQQAGGASHTFMGSGDPRVLNCIEMNGTGGAASASTVNNGTWTQMALSVWVKVPTGSKSVTQGGTVVDGAFLGFQLTVTDDGSGAAMYRVLFDNTLPGSLTTTASSGDWHHVLAQNDGITTTFYLDGQLVGTTSELLYTVNNGQPGDVNLARINVGQLGSSSGKYSGKISSLRIYNRLLTNTEIQYLSGNGSIPSKRIYVHWNALGSNDGTTWANAYTDFHTALTNANAHDTIWVVRGSFFPQSDTTGNANPADMGNKAFLWNKNLHLYGGFMGSETSLSQRQPGLKTNLSGDLFGDTEAKTVIFAKHLNASSLMDGFVLENAVTTSYGGGMQCAFDNMMTIQNCEFKNNKAYRGSGLCAMNNCHIVVKNSTFHDNTTTQSGDHAGAGVHGIASSFFFQNCIFYNNSAKYGAAVELEGNGSGSGLAKTTFANCLFHDNVAGHWGSPAIYGYFVTAGIAIYNCTFVNNVTQSTQAHVGEAIGINGGSYTAYNSIFWSNSDRSQLYDAVGLSTTFTLENCIVKGGYSGTGSNNSATYPDFADTTANDFHLTGNSVALNAGRTDTTGLLQWLGTRDLDGNGRFYGNTIDIGCYELQAKVAADPVRTAVIRLYPNPAHDLLTVETPIPCLVSVRDLTGKTLMNVMSPGNVTLDLHGLPAGIYLLQTGLHEGETFVKE